MDKAITLLSGSLRSWFQWRTSKRGTLAGWLSVFGAQAVAGAMLLGTLLYLFGAPFSAVTIFVTIIFSIASGLSGIGFSFLYAFVFLQISSIAMGISMGVWFGSPSWWRTAAEQWENGTTVPKIVVIVGIILPIIWAASCFPLHKAWIKVWQMVFKKIFSRQKKNEDDRRARAFERLSASDEEVDKALKNSKSEPTGLSVIGRTKIIREIEPEEEDEPADAYAALHVGNNADELKGLNEAADRSRQKVDAAGAVVAADNDIVSVPALPSVKAEPVATAKPLHDASGSVDSSNSVSSRPAARGENQVENPSQLVFLAEQYILELSRSLDEQEAFDRFIRQYESALLNFTDREIEFLRSLPDGAGRGLAEAAVQFRSAFVSIDTSFEAAVQKGIEDFDIDPIKRPTSDISDDDLVTFGFESVSELSSEDNVVEDGDFSSDFDFSGDQASKKESGRTFASLLARAASPDNVARDPAPSSTTAVFKSPEDVISEIESDSSLSDDSDADPESGDSPFDGRARLLELLGDGLPLDQAKATVEREKAELEQRSSSLEERLDLSDSEANDDSPEDLLDVSFASEDADAPGSVSIASEHESDLSSHVDGVEGEESEPLSDQLDLPTEEDGHHNSDGFEPISNAADESESASVPLKQFGGFILDDEASESKARNDDNIVPESDGLVSAEELALQDSDLPDEDSSAGDSLSSAEDRNDSDNSDLHENTEINEESIDLSEETLVQERNKKMIPIKFNEEQARKIYECMSEHETTRKEKYDRLIAIENEDPDYMDTLSVLRSSRFAEMFSEPKAQEMKNVAAIIIREHKDSLAREFGELAADCEARAEEMLNAPYKVDMTKIGTLKGLVLDLERMIKDEKPSDEAASRRLRLSKIRGSLARIEDTYAEAMKPRVAKKSPINEAQRKRAQAILSGAKGGDVEIADEDTSFGSPVGGFAEPFGSDDNEEIDLAQAMNADDSVQTDDSSEDDFSDKPWLDPSLGDLEEDFPLVPEGVDPSSIEGMRLMQERLPIKIRREEAIKLRDEFLQREEEKRIAREREEQERIAKQVKMADLAQREEALKERENDILERIHKLEQQSASVEAERERVFEQERRLGDKIKLLDDLSSVIDNDASKKIEALKYVSKAMQGFFQVESPPPRFMKVEAQFMDIAFNKAIQRRVKASSIGLHEVFNREFEGDLPERLFPHRSVSIFHGATIFRKASEIVHEIAADLDVEVKIPSSMNESLSADLLCEKCSNEEERIFVEKVVGILNASRSEFFELHNAVDANVDDYRAGKKLESGEVQDIQTLKEANAKLKKDNDDLSSEVSSYKVKVQELEEKLKARPRNVGANIDYDDEEEIEFLREFLFERGFHVNTGRLTAEVGFNRGIFGIPKDFLDPAKRTKFYSEVSRYPDQVIVIFTNVPEAKAEETMRKLLVDDFQNHFYKVVPIDPESITEFLKTIEETIED